MSSPSSTKAPAVYYIIIIIKCLSIAGIAKVFYSFVTSTSSTGAHDYFIYAKTLVDLLLSIGIVFLLIRRNKFAFKIFVIDYVVLLAGIFWALLNHAPDEVNGAPMTTWYILGIPVVFWLLVVLKVRDFCKTGLLK